MRFDALREAVLLAFDQIRANKFRSALTILGIVVGVATVMTMSALISGVRSSILEGIEAAGPKNFIVTRFNFNEARVTHGNERPAWMDNRGASVAEARRISALDKVRTAIIATDVRADLSSGRERMEGVQITGSDVGWSEFTTGTMTAGHDFLPSDVLSARPVIIVTTDLAEKLFGALDPIGRTVRVQGTQFTVVATFKQDGNIFGDQAKHFGVVPYSAALKYLGADEEWLRLLVVTADHARQDEAIDQVIATMRTMRGLRPTEANNFAIMRQDEMVAMFNRFTGVFFVVMLALSSVGLMVGGVGVVAIMMISVTERTREIGIRKALGATRREILWQFLIEATTVTILGGVIGMLIGGAAAFLTQALTPIPASVPLWAVAAALGMATVAGVAFGLWPAWRAASLDPVAALRYE
jgi:putative ABC transport system permease protein